MRLIGGWLSLSVLTMLISMQNFQNYFELFRSLSILLFLFSLIGFLIHFNRISFILILFAISSLITENFLKTKYYLLNLQEKIKPQSEKFFNLQGKVVSFPEIGQQFSIFYFQVEKLNDETLSRPFNVRMRIPGRIDYITIFDQLKLQCPLRVPDFPENFLPSDNNQLFLTRNAPFNGFLKSPLLIEEHRQSSFIWQLLKNWRNRLRQTIHNQLDGKEQLNKRAFLLATLLGDRLLLDSQEKETMINSGIYHFFAISGANIAMLAMIFLQIFSWLKFPRQTVYLLTTLIVIFYYTISGFETSASRAVIMFLFFCLARILFEQVNPFNLLGLTAFLLTMLNPAQFLDPSFWLTFLLTLAIISGRMVFSGLFKVLPGNLAEFTSANLSAYLFSLPLSLYFFNRCSLLSFFSTALLTFPVSLITFLSFLLIFSTFLSTPTTIIFLVLKPLLYLFFFLGKFFAQFSSTILWQARPPFFLLLLTFTLFLFTAFTKQKVVKIFLHINLIMLIIFSLSGLKIDLKKDRSKLQFYFLDLQGSECSIFRFPSGKSLIFDCGGAAYGDFNVGRSTLLPFFKERQIVPEYFLISHFHADHCRGLLEIFPFIRPAEIFISFQNEQNFFFRQLIDLKPAKTRITQIRAGFALFRENFSARLLWPLQICFNQKNLNNCSQVWLVEAEGFRILLCADIDQMVEDKLLSLYPGLRAEVIKIAHHGSQFSSSFTFLQQVRPSLALLAASRPLKPNHTLRKALKQLKIALLETSRHGAVLIEFENGQLHWQVSKDHFHPIFAD